MMILDDDLTEHKAQYLSIHCLLKASSNVSVLTDVRCGVAVPVPVWVFAAVLAGVFVSISGLGALLDRVSPLRGDWSLPGLDSSYLVDLDIGLWRVLNVDIHQGWVERCWRRRDQCRRQFTVSDF